MPEDKNDTRSTQFWVKMRAPKTKAITAFQRYCDLTIEVRQWVMAFVFSRTNDGVFFEWNMVGIKVFSKMTANNSSNVRVETLPKEDGFYISQLLMSRQLIYDLLCFDRPASYILHQ